MYLNVVLVLLKVNTRVFKAGSFIWQWKTVLGMWSFVKATEQHTVFLFSVCRCRWRYTYNKTFWSKLRYQLSDFIQRFLVCKCESVWAVLSVAALVQSYNAKKQIMGHAPGPLFSHIYFSSICPHWFVLQALGQSWCLTTSKFQQVNVLRHFTSSIE